MAAEYAVREEPLEGHPAVVLSAGGELEATFVPSVGMVGASLRHRGDELLGQRKGISAYAETGSTMGIPILHPWANRLEGRRYEHAGRTVELDPASPLVRENPEGCPIHGVLAASPHWQVLEQRADGGGARLTATLDFAVHAELLDAFPFPHELQTDVALTENRLSIATTLTATGDVPVPISFGYHPYLRLPDVPRADWHVELPVRRRLVLDDRQIPTGETEPVSIPPGPLGERTFDDGFAELADPPVFALAGGGRRVQVAFVDGYRFAQVFAPPTEDVICFEPMTAPTNALASGRDLPLAAPGSSYRAEFAIEVAA